MRKPPYWMMNYIHSRVAQRAAIVEYQYSWQAELQKSEKLVELETRERETQKIRKIKLDRLVL